MRAFCIGSPEMTTQELGHSYITQAAYTIFEFCDAHRISRTHLHNLQKAGKGPRIMKVGKRVLISMDSAADWRRALEREQAVAA